MGLVDAGGPVSMGGTIDKGMYYGSTTDGAQQMKFAGIEDLWGNVFEWVEGFETDKTISNYLIKYGNQSMVVPSGLADYNYGYVSKTIGNTEGGFTGVEFEGDNSTFYADRSGFSPSRVLHFGGIWSDGLAYALFYLAGGCSADDALQDIGARLTYI